jgi:hypothetical protein
VAALIGISILKAAAAQYVAANGNGESCNASSYQRLSAFNVPISMAAKWRSLKAIG